MNKLWLLKGSHNAPGWKNLEKEAKSGETDVLHFDRDAWALMRAPEAPTQYEGMTATEPADGVYIDQQGRAVYLVGGEEVRGARDVIKALGEDAEKLFEKVGDPEVTLERLGRAF